MPDTYMRYEVKDHVATLTMDRPPVNALDFQLMDGILAALRRAGDDPEVRAVVVNSAVDHAFCAGLDLKAVQEWSSNDVKRFLEKIYIELYDVQNALGKPSIAAVRGAARGGALASPFRAIWSSPARRRAFLIPKFTLALSPPFTLSICRASSDAIVPLICFSMARRLARGKRWISASSAAW